MQKNDEDKKESEEEEEKSDKGEEKENDEEDEIRQESEYYENNIFQNKEIKANVIYFYLGIFLYLTCFLYFEKHYFYTIILFLVSDVFLFYYMANDVQCFVHVYHIYLCYLVLSRVVNCFRVKYYLPFLSCLLANKISEVFIILNIFFLVDSNIYSIIFTFLNIIFSFKEIKQMKLYFLFHYISIYFLLIKLLNPESINIFLYFILLVPIILAFFYIKNIALNLLKITIFFLIFSFIYFIGLNNENIKKELNDEGLIITISNYSILLALLIIELIEKCNSKKNNEISENDFIYNQIYEEEERKDDEMIIKNQSIEYEKREDNERTQNNFIQNQIHEEEERENDEMQSEIKILKRKRII